MKEIDLSKLAELVAEGPAGQDKIKRQAKAINELQEALMLMVKRVRPYEVPVKTKDNTIKFGVIGDTHIGSLYQRTDALKKFYQACGEEGVRHVLHVGDVIDGWHVYKGQEFELHPEGRSWPGQRDMFAQSIPYCPDIETIFISGNHDASYKNVIGMVVGDELQRVRPDFKFVGQDVGDVILKAKDGSSLKIRLVHPGGGTAYAISYRLQKFIEAIPGGEKPDLLLLGHYHKAEMLPSYRNVCGIQAGTFQSQTSFMARQASAAHVGGWIVEATMGERKNLTHRFRAEFISFLEPDASVK
jgi:UDP-2,3-diacylglucosamine pyrophosphatase LpxH